MSDKVRQPKQERSIETKNKILAAGYELFSTVGYFCTNTAQIAKKAGVSTGIVYGYFKDKRDILSDVLATYVGEAFAPILAVIDRLSSPVDVPSLTKDVLDAALDLHRKNANIHEALHSLSHTDQLVSARFIELEDNITLQIAERLASLGVSKDGLLEKVHLAMDIVQSFSHECIFDKHDYIDYDAMRKLVESAIVSLFE